MNALGQREKVEATSSSPALRSHTWNWAYNSRGELTKAGEAAQQWDYAYDTIGNRLRASVAESGAPVRQWQYQSNALNQYTSVSSASSVVKPSYDADGNMLSDGSHTCTWDAENELTTITQGKLTVTNTYDHLHRRVRKTVTTTENGQQKTVNDLVFIYDGWNLIAELSITPSSISDLPSPRVLRTYVWGPDLSNTMQGAGGVGGLLSVTLHQQPQTIANQAQPSQTLFPTYDGNGNITAYVDEKGAITSTRSYDAFGNTIAQSSISDLPSAIPFGFSTKYTDAETGWLYYGYRFYRPDDGRWINRDPIGERGGENIYAYLSNQSLDRVDKLGLETILLFVGQAGKSDFSFRAAAETKQQEIENSAAFNSKCDTVAIVDVTSVSDMQSALGCYRDIVQIHYFGHGGPGLLFIGEGHVAEENLSGPGGDASFALLYRPVTTWNTLFMTPYPTTSVHDLDKSNILTGSSRNQKGIWLSSCFSGTAPYVFVGTSIVDEMSNYFGLPAVGWSINGYHYVEDANGTHAVDALEYHLKELWDLIEATTD